MLDLGSGTLPLGERTLVMGIINCTPDSFSDAGKYNSVDRALDRALQMVAEGADILDIGGESTRPGALVVSLEEELERVIPVIEKIAREVDIPLSVDTYKAEVARAAVEAGAHMISDVWGAKADPLMPSTAAMLGVPIILTHNRKEGRYRSFIEDVLQDLRESIQLVESHGLPKEQVILDPGIGFAKNTSENLLIVKNVNRIVQLGFPVLLGTSRKSFIGNVLDLPVEERLEGSLCTVAYGITQGCHIVRVHDVKETVRVCRMMDALLHA